MIKPKIGKLSRVKERAELRMSLNMLLIGGELFTNYLQDLNGLMLSPK